MRNKLQLNSGSETRQLRNARTRFVRAEGYPVRDEALVQLCPDGFECLNRLGTYTFAE